ncbi:hypothetical protein BU53_30055 [Escherichia coli O91:H21 str. 2009C-3740]|nr:hypothetical protein BU53_30055 [Escherichia coli O91:H21 str. 2009C-3740]
MKKTAPDGAVSGMPAIRETGPGKNLQAITVSTWLMQYIELARVCRPDKAFTPHPAVIPDLYGLRAISTARLGAG